MQKIQILFPEPVMVRLRKLSQIQDRPISELVRRAVEESLARTPELKTTTSRFIPVFKGGKILCSKTEMRDFMYQEDRSGASS
jgi:hypothetical protein